MDAKLYNWADAPEDNPVPLLTRRKISGEEILVARVSLAKGCHVAVHNHVSEQIAMMVSGKVRWTLGHEGAQYELVTQAGDVLHLPSNFPHGVDTLEDSEIIDMLSPPGPMGVDSQSSP